MTVGTPIYAPVSGNISYAQWNSTGYGLLMKIEEEGSDRVHWLAHLSKFFVTSGHVNQGDLVALSGSTGPSSAHLHYHVQKADNTAIDVRAQLPNINWFESDMCRPTMSTDGEAQPSRIPNGITNNNNCADFYNAGVTSGVYGFDAPNCQGKVIFGPLGQGNYDLGNTAANDRLRSISTPGNLHFWLYGNSDNESLKHCHERDMWNLDTDRYNDSSYRIGWDNSYQQVSAGGQLVGSGWNMVSRLVVTSNSCPSNQNSTTSATEVSDGYGIGGGWEGGGQTGNSHVDLFADHNYTGTQYGWDNPTYEWINLSPFVNYMDNQADSIQLDAGYSIMVADGENGTGGKKCFVSSHPELSGAYYDNGVAIRDTISSVWVYEDSTCDNTYIGTEPGDTVTVWVDPNYSNTHYGWHDPYSGNTENYVSNAISSVGVTPGWSVVIYEGQSLGGGFACFIASDSDLTDNTLNNGASVNDSVESIEVFHDMNCGGRMHAPTINELSAAVTSQSNGEVTITYNVSGAAPGYSVHTSFGDGSNDFDILGPTVNTTATHNYAYGNYTIIVSIKGTDGLSYPYSIPITVSAPATATPTVPVYSLTIDSANTASGLVNFTLDWSNALGDWHHIDFGDGQSFDVNGASGHQSASHIYNPGQNPYTLSFTVKGQDSQNYVASQQVSMPLPTVSLTINSVDPVTGFTMFTAAWTDAPIDSWQRITFGQEDFYVDYQGASDTKVDSHIYPPGTYTMTLTVNCRNGQTYTATQQVVVTGPTATPVPPTATPVQPSHSLTIDSVDQSSGLTTFTLDWGSALADWHHIDFGDGQAFDVNGGSGHQQATHIYNPGTYTMTFTVKGLDGQNYPSTQQITVSGPPTATPVPAPTLSLTILSVDNATGVVSFQAVWNNALNDWQHMDFGHDGAYVDYQGGSGDHTDSNIIPVGTYTFTLTVKGMDGQNYTASQQVTRS